MVNNNVSLKAQKISLCVGFIVILIFMVPLFIIGIDYLVTGISSSKDERNQIKNYTQVSGELKEYKDCSYNDKNGYELCKAVYEYQVNGITYTVTSSYKGVHEAFEQNKAVYYNPKNPSESLMLSNSNSKIVGGAIMITLILFGMIFYIIKWRKVLKR